MPEHSIFLDVSTVDQHDLDLSPLRNACPDLELHQQIRLEDKIDCCQRANILITNKHLIDQNCIEAAAELKLICVTATGTDNIDLNAAKNAGVHVCNVTAYATPSVVQHVFALILNQVTQLHQYQQSVASGNWQTSKNFCLLDYPIRELAGLTIGIIGYGELGKAVAKVAEAFGMRVLVSQRPGGAKQAGRLPVNDVLAQADVISLHVPLADNTYHLIDRQALSLMKSDALLINTARGAVIDNQALADALRNKQIGGAGIDVLDTEPPTDDHPLLQPDIKNLTVTPHIGWASKQARQRAIDETALNIQAFLKGLSRNQVC